MTRIHCSNLHHPKTVYKPQHYLNVLNEGSGMIETIQLRIRLLGNAAGISTEEISTDITALSIKLEKSAIASGAIIIDERDLDDVTCYLELAQRLCQLVCTT